MNMEIKIIENMVRADLAHVISDEQAAHPGVTGDALVTAVVSDLRHYVRGKLGFVTDLIWTAQVQSALAAVVREAVALEWNLGAATS